MTPARSYRPGEWFGIFGTRAHVLLPPSQKARVAALWEQVDEGAGFDDLLDSLIAGGLRSLPAFVLVTTGEDPVRIVLRGETWATLVTGAGETVELDGTTAATWVERSVDGVSSLQVRVGDDEGPDLGLFAGLVRVSRVDEPAVRDQVQAPPAAEPGVEPLSDAEVEADAVTEAIPAGPPPGPPPFPPPGFAPPPPPGPPGPPPPFPPPGPPPGFAPPAGFAPPPVPASPAESAPDDHDGHTRGGGEPDGSRSEATAPAVARLLFSSGESIDVDRAVLIGRAPEARRVTSPDQPRLVTVTSPNLEISSTHLEVRPGSGADHGCAVATDLASTNGTVLTLPGLLPEDLRPGMPTQLVPGAVIDLGDGVTIRVTNP